MAEKRQYGIPGVGYLNEVSPRQFAVPGSAYVNTHATPPSILNSAGGRINRFAADFDFEEGWMPRALRAAPAPPPDFSSVAAPERDWPFFTVDWHPPRPRALSPPQDVASTTPPPRRAWPFFLLDWYPQPRPVTSTFQFIQPAEMVGPRRRAWPFLATDVWHPSRPAPIAPPFVSPDVLVAPRRRAWPFHTVDWHPSPIAPVAPPFGHPAEVFASPRRQLATVVWPTTTHVWHPPRRRDYVIAPGSIPLTPQPLRASQILIEAVDGGIGPVLATQVLIEAVDAGSAVAHTSQAVLEAVDSGAGPVRTSQVRLQVPTRDNFPGRVTQSRIEVLLANHVVPMPLIYPELRALGYEVIARPIFSTAIDQHSSLREARMSYAASALWEFELIYNWLGDVQGNVDFRTLAGFFLAVGGSGQTFLFRWADDYKVAAGPLGLTDGTTAAFTLVRAFGDGTFDTIDPIGQLKAGTFQLYIDGVAKAADDPTYSYSLTTGVLNANLLRFDSTPAGGHVITADFEFYYSVRFKEDSIDFAKFMKGGWDAKKVVLRSTKQ